MLGLCIKRHIVVIAFLVLVIAGRWGGSLVADVSARDTRLKHHVYVAFGFHVNLYHSFRGDTNDENGFGKDIRIIRHILNHLDRFNVQGVPVRASWDFDNLFSLQHLLPKYAPDIIETVRRRVTQGRDEVLLMSYNNGLASAMNRKELTDSIRWAIRNPWGSGVEDLFGDFSPIVRPQEMMTTPGNFDIYRRLGIQAIALYYSAAPFDAFRVFARSLTPEEAHNPLTYVNNQTAEQLLLIPTYNIGDLVENVSLSHWVQRLRRLQQKGRINRDVLIFINFDADSDYWGGLDVKWPLDLLPNTVGIEGLIDEVRNLDYVRFTTLQDYLTDHASAGTVSFGQDTADGSFDGYNSWSEKAFTTDYWTRIVASRRIHQIADKVIAQYQDPEMAGQLTPLLESAYLKRLKAMSTTHFGMSTPFVAPHRQAAMQTILSELDTYEKHIAQRLESVVLDRLRNARPAFSIPDGLEWVDTVLLMNTVDDGGNQFVSLSLPGQATEDSKNYYLMDQSGQMTDLSIFHNPKGRNHLRYKAYISGPKALPDGLYFLFKGPSSGEPHANLYTHVTGNRVTLGNQQIRISFDSLGTLEEVSLDGVTKLRAGSLLPYIRYNGDLNLPRRLKSRILSNGMTDQAAIEMSGPWVGPDDQTQLNGSVAYTFTVLDDLPYLFVDGRLRLPATNKTDVLKADARHLSRQVDLGWQEVAPAELRLAQKGDRRHPVRVLKHNYVNVHSSFDLDYFKHSEKNLNLDNVNNHITANYAGIAAGGSGVAVAMDNSLAANFAFAPIKVRYDVPSESFSARLNPFGTYHGRQYRHPSWGNRQGWEAAQISGEQYHSAAPTFNGRTIRFGLVNPRP